MPRAKKWTCDDGREGLVFTCPACNGGHSIVTAGTGAWGWNGSLDAPTLSPSVLLRSGHYAPEHKPGDRCWCTYNAEHPDKPAPFSCGVCHSYVTDGRIQLLGDCTHALAGQTVDLPQIPA